MENKNSVRLLGGRRRRRRRDAIRAAVVVVVFVLLSGSGLFGCVRKLFWNYEGPWDGTVVDAETGKPIEGAQVKITASYSGFMMGQPCGEKYEFGQTDIDGRFHINSIQKFAPTQHYALYFTVYKKGYVGFNPMGSVGKTYKVVDYEKFFKQKYIEIRLVKWDDTKLTMKDHVKNIDMIGCDIHVYGYPGNQTFCREAREEMILACVEDYKDATYPRTRNECQQYVDRNLGLPYKPEE